MAANVLFSLQLALNVHLLDRNSNSTKPIVKSLTGRGYLAFSDTRETRINFKGNLAKLRSF